MTSLQKIVKTSFIFVPANVLDYVCLAQIQTVGHSEFNRLNAVVFVVIATYLDI